jgi:6,7-dimethyl-8-ribityllumazine synthase
MSASGAPTAQQRTEGWVKTELIGLCDVAVVAANWHKPVMDGLIDGALAALDWAGAVHRLYRVPGSFELPLLVSKVLGTGQFDAAVALGVVIRGGTPHFEHVCRAATDGLLQVSVRYQRPVGFGLLTCDNERQAFDRAGLAGSKENKGREAAEAALELLAEIRRARSDINVLSEDRQRRRMARYPLDVPTPTL